MTLRQLLQRHGVTQHDLVERLHLKRQYAFMLWDGQRRLGHRLGKRVSDAFGISLDDLLRAEPDQPGSAPPQRLGRPPKRPRAPDETAALESIATAMSEAARD